MQILRLHNNNYRQAILYAVPLTFTLLRMALGILLVAGFFDTFDGKPGVYFLPCFVLASLSDALDGFLARKLGVTSAFGAVMDSIADLTLYGGVLISISHTHPYVIDGLRILIPVGLTLQLLHIAFGLIKFHKYVSYHSHLAKITAVIAFLGVVDILLSNSPGILLLIAFFLWIVSNIEGMVMTLVLPKYINNVTNIFWAWQYSLSPK